MAKFEQYEPQVDSGRVFDGEEFEDEIDDEGSRLPLLLVIGLLVVAAFGGVVWLAYTQGVLRGREDAPRMLVAASGPVKVAPANPGGEQTPFKGLKIYQQPAASDDDGDADAAPQSPTPVAPAAQKVAQAPAPIPAPAPAPMAAAPKPVPQAPAAPPPLPVVKAAQAATPKPAPMAVATKPPRTLQSTQPVQPAAVASAPPSPPKKAVAAIAAPEAPAATDSGSGMALQIGAYKSEADANTAWQAFEHKHPMVNGYQSQVQKADLGDKGIWYRLRMGSFADKTAALAFCDKLKADGGNCFPAK